jgi:transposase
MTMTMADLPSGSPEEHGDRAARPTVARPGHATRRVFSPAYKLRIVAEYDSLTGHGARGALLRREGLYSSHVVQWRRARDRDVSAAKGAGRQEVSAEAKENRRLVQENARLAAELEKAKAVVDILGKACALLEVLSESAERPMKLTRPSTGR